MSPPVPQPVSQPGTQERQRTAPQPMPQPTTQGLGRPGMSHSADPPIYRAMLRHWESAGRTLPGRHDTEWNRIMTTPVWSDVRVSASRGPRGDGR